MHCLCCWLHCDVYVDVNIHWYGVSCVNEMFQFVVALASYAVCTLCPCMNWSSIQKC